MALLVSIYVKIYWLTFNLPFSLVWIGIQLAVFLSPLCDLLGNTDCSSVSKSPTFVKVLIWSVSWILWKRPWWSLTHIHIPHVYIFKVLEILFSYTEINLLFYFKTLLLLKLCIGGCTYMWGRMLAEPEASGPLLLWAGATAVVSRLLWVLGTDSPVIPQLCPAQKCVALTDLWESILF